MVCPLLVENSEDRNRCKKTALASRGAGQRSEKALSGPSSAGCTQGRGLVTSPSQLCTCAPPQKPALCGGVAGWTVRLCAIFPQIECPRYNPKLQGVSRLLFTQRFCVRTLFWSVLAPWRPRFWTQSRLESVYSLNTGTVRIIITPMSSNKWEQ